MESLVTDKVEDALDKLAAEAAHDLPAYCQKRTLIYRLKTHVQRGTGTNITTANAVYYFRECLEWLDNLQAATNPLVGSPDDPSSIRLKNALRKEKSDIAEHPEHYVWLRLSLVRAMTDPNSKNALWRVDMQGVSNCANTYLHAEWSSVPSLEWLMTDALAYAEAIAFLEDSKGLSGALPSTFLDDLEVDFLDWPNPIRCRWCTGEVWTLVCHS